MSTRKRYPKCVLKPTDNVYLCSVCQKVQTSLFEMRQHIKIHKTFQCEVCLRTFKAKQHLNNHTVTHHQKLEYSCPLCKKVFPHIRYLEQHTKIHSPVKRFICEVCGKQFTQMVHLKSHTATHQLQKPFPCKLCTKEFSCKGSLLRHCRIHAEENKLKCNICNKMFTRKDSLVLHVKIIHELKKKNYKCGHCNLIFSHKNNLKAHCKKLHMNCKVQNSESPKSSVDLCVLKKEDISKRKTFSVSILERLTESNKTDFFSTKHDIKSIKREPLEKHDIRSIKSEPLEKHDIKNEPLESRNSASVSVVPEENCKSNDLITENEEKSKFMSTDKSDTDLSSTLVAKLKSSSSSESVFKDSFDKRDKNCSTSFALFSDSDVNEIFDSSPTNFGTDFLLDSFGDWEKECQLEDGSLPGCSIDPGIDLEPNHDFSNKDFLTSITEEYFTMPF